jgi:hypothetical protein
MGGLSNWFVDLAKPVGSVVGKALGKTATEGAEWAESGLYHRIFKPEAAFADIPAAKELWDAYTGPYHQLTNKYIAEGVAEARASGTNIVAHEIEQAAKKQASDEVFDEHRQVIQGVLKHVEKTVGKNRADILADHLNVLLQEAPIKAGPNKGKSTFDVDMMRGGSENGFDTPATKYRPPSLAEKTATIHQRTLAYKAAIPHLASNLNILLSDGFKTYAQTLGTTFGPGRKAAEAQVLATNAIGELTMNSYKEKQAFEKGLIHQFAPGGVGEFIHRNMYIPGMSSVRYNTLMMSAHASMLAAKEASDHLMQGDMKYALPMMHELKLDPNKILAQHGQFLPEDVEKIYYHGTDTRAFLSQGDKRTIMGQKSPLYRTMGAFHKYVSNQASFMKYVFKRQFQQGDFVGIARNLSLLATVFPVLGATIYESERLLSGKDWDDPVGHSEHRIEGTPLGVVYDSVEGKNKATSKAKIALQTIDNLSHLASFGVATGYIRGASRAHLAEQMLGPDATMAIQGFQDVLKAAHYDDKHKAAAKPLKRDLLSDIPSLGLGSILSHKLVPTKAEVDKDKPKKYRYHRTRGSDEGNILNSKDDY